jgi:hypothetical protein
MAWRGCGGEVRQVVRAALLCALCLLTGCDSTLATTARENASLRIQLAAEQKRNAELEADYMELGAAYARHILSEPPECYAP